MPNKTTLMRRLFLLLLGNAVHTLGIALITHAGLGTMPVTTLGYSLARVADVTLGTMTFVVNLVFFAAQGLLLGPRFRKILWFQIPSVFVFSAFIDMWLALLAHVPVTGFGCALTMSLAANVLAAVGILYQIKSDTLVQPVEGAVLALAMVTNRAFATLKIGNDCLCVASAALVSIVMMGDFDGIGPGTLVSAVMVGLVVRVLRPFIIPGGVAKADAAG